MANQNDNEMTVQLLRITQILSDAYIQSTDEDFWQALEEPLNQYQDNCKLYRVILKQVGDLTTIQDLEYIKKKHHDARIAMVENQMDLIPLTMELNVFLSDKITQHDPNPDPDEDSEDPVADTDSDTDLGNG